MFYAKPYFNCMWTSAKRVFKLNKPNFELAGPGDLRLFVEFCLFFISEMTARFEMASPVGQRCILQYMLPWLSNIELVDVSNCFPSPPEVIIQKDEEAHTGPMSPVKLDGEGWGSLEATQLVLNNLFYITVKVSWVLSNCRHNAYYL